MIVYNDCNRKGKALILLAGFLKRDCLVTFSKISLVFLLQLLVKSFSITTIIIVIIINILIIIIIHLNLYLVSLLWDILVFIILSLFIYCFCVCCFCVCVSFILNSFLLHFPTFISYFDLFLFFNFVIPISPPTFYYFKCYPYWP